MENGFTDWCCPMKHVGACHSTIIRAVEWPKKYGTYLVFAYKRGYPAAESNAMEGKTNEPHREYLPCALSTTPEMLCFISHLSNPSIPQFSNADKTIQGTSVRSTMEHHSCHPLVDVANFITSSPAGRQFGGRINRQWSHQNDIA
jgi:hypothetical protein